MVRPEKGRGDLPFCTRGYSGQHYSNNYGAWWSYGKDGRVAKSVDLWDDDWFKKIMEGIVVRKAKEIYG